MKKTLLIPLPFLLIVLSAQTPELQFSGTVVFTDASGPEMCGTGANAYMTAVWDGCGVQTTGTCDIENTTFFGGTEGITFNMGDFTLDVNSFQCIDAPLGDHRLYTGGNANIMQNGQIVLELTDIWVTFDSDYLNASMVGSGIARLNMNSGDAQLVNELNPTGTEQVEFAIVGSNAVIQGACGFYDFQITVTPLESMTIAEARAQLGNTVTTSGIVTQPNLAAVGESDFAIQDSTAAIIIYSGSFDAGLTIGDLVTVTGEIQNYNGKLEIVPSEPTDVTVVSQGNALPPIQHITLSGFLTDPESFEAELVQVFNVEIVDGTWPDPSSNANLTITDDGSVTTLTMRVDRHSDVDDGPEPVGIFNLTGIVAQYDWSFPQDEGYQIIPRFQTDIESPDPGILTIFQARNTALGTIVTTRGFITTPVWGSNRIDYGLQDATGGIALFLYGSTLDLQIGDLVVVTGEIQDYNGKAEIVPSDVADITIISTGNVIPAVQEMTIAEFLAAAESFESELIRFNTAMITGGTWPSSGSNANLDITDVSDSTMTMRVDRDTDVDEGIEPQGTFAVTGISGQFDSSPPADEGYQILPRFYSDIEVLGDISPVISNLSHTPTAPTPDDIVTVSADVIDDGTVTVNLNYQIDSGGYLSSAMTTGNNLTYTGDIPPQADGAMVNYFVSADDGVNATVYSDTALFVVHAPEALTAIYDIQYTTDPSGDSPLAGQEVTIGGIVTAEFWGGSGNRNIYVQDAEAAYSGVVVFEYGGWNNFDMETPTGEIVHTVAEGDSVVITGTVVEYYGKTEITDVTQFTVYGPAARTIAPIDVSPGQIMTGGTEPEAYEGVLVRVSNVIVDSENLGYGEWSVTDGLYSVVVDDNWDYYYWPQEDAELNSVTGCLDYSFSNFKIQPRLARDVVESGAVRIQRIQQVLYSDLLKTGEDSESDKSYMVEETVTITGIVTMPTGLSYAGDGVKFIFADAHGGPWSGILSYDPDSTAFPTLVEGDLIQATGFISEYTTAGSNMTELFITQPIAFISGGNAQPAVPTIATGDLRWPTEAEQWGTVIVKVKNATVIENDLSFGEWSVDDGTGSVNIDDDSDSLSNFIRPPVGTLVDSIRGWVYHHFGSYSDSTTYKVEPLYLSDVVLTTGGVFVDHRATWNMVGLPMDVDDPAYGSVYPGSVNGTCYGFDGTYYNADLLLAGEGYWLYFNDSGSDLVSGTTITSLTIALATGWNMISGISEAVDVAAIGDPGGIIVPGTVYGFDGTYVNASSVAPGKGYWVNASADGDITITGGVMMKTRPEFEDYTIGANSISFNGQTLYFSVSIPEEEILSYQLPPKPPEGAFDVRFAGGWKVAEEAGTIELMSNTEKLTLAYTINIAAGENNRWMLVSNTGSEYELDGSGEIVITDNVTGFTLSKISEIPSTFSISQNYPNPFNPMTQIRFELPTDEQVQLVIYDMLGRQVRTLVNSPYKAGVHISTWDGTNNRGELVSSGIYFYRIKAGDYLNHKKMMLIR